MACNGKAKVKILYLLKILQEETDVAHGLTMAQIIERLAEYGVSAERKSIYDDIKALREFDIDVKTYQRNPIEYAIERRDFTIDELMLMVDAIQSCRAITDSQAKLLVTNIKQLASSHEQVLLDRRIHVEGRIKSKSESALSTAMPSMRPSACIARWISPIARSAWTASRTRRGAARSTR